MSHLLCLHHGCTFASASLVTRSCDVQQVQAIYLAAASHASMALHRLMAGGSPGGASAAAQLQHAKMMAETAESLAKLVNMASPTQPAGALASWEQLYVCRSQTAMSDDSTCRPTK